MKERPILFSAPMVRALLSGAKTQTRRIVKPQQPRECQPLDAPYSFELTERNGDVTLYTLEQFVERCPYGAPGDRLWVREAFAYSVRDPDASNEVIDETTYDAVYRATQEHEGAWTHYDENGKQTPTKPKWKPGIHMPRWASRITLEVTRVRVERLHAITEDDARAEGCTGYPGAVDATPREEFEELWKDINGLDSWRANPWVWVVEFRRVEADAARGAA
ncbi:MAG TPA: hypothetical protein VIV58_22590 [Kofleriaceae bacterium]